MVIEQGTEKLSGFRGQRIPLSGKSVLFGWLQTFLVLFGIVNSCWGAILLTQQHVAANNGFAGTLKLALGILCLFAWLLFTLWPFKANDDRADELRAHLGLEPVVREEWPE